jgi:hypothetical protein
MNDLITWLRAQLDDDERVARLWPEHDWRAVGDEVVSTEDLVVAESGAAEHIARWDPARVLALIADVRRMIRMFEQRADEGQQPGGQVFGYHATGMGTAIRCITEGLYADREGYRDEWRP